jgi:hypothetical protein
MHEIQNIHLGSSVNTYVTLMEISTHSATFYLFTRNGFFFVRPCHYVMTHPQLAYEKVQFQILKVAANLMTKL